MKDVAGEAAAAAKEGRPKMADMKTLLLSTLKNIRAVKARRPSKNGGYQKTLLVSTLNT